MRRMKNLLLLLCLLSLIGCTTQRPVYLSKPSGKDTVVLKSTVINNEVRTIENAKLIHDTLYIEKLVKIPGTAVIDTVALGDYISRSLSQSNFEIMELSKKLDLLQLFLSKTKKSDSVRVIMQKIIDTTNLEKKVAQEKVAATETIIYKFPKYIYLLLLIVGLYFSLKYLYQKRRLKIKEAQHTRNIIKNE